METNEMPVVALSDELRTTEEEVSTDTDVLILQDMEFGSSDLAFVTESIIQSCNDLQSVAKTLQNLHQAVSESRSVKILRTSQARSLNRSLYSRYGRPMKMSMEESYNLLDQDGATIALEEEKNDSKGLFYRIWEKIVEAFNWLWKKLTALFSKGDDPEKKKDETDKASNAIAEKESSGINFANIDTDTFGVNRAFNFMGKPVSISNIERHLQEMAQRLPALKNMMQAANNAFDALLAVARNMNGKPEGLSEPLRKTSSIIEAAINGLPVGSVQDFEKAGSKQIFSEVSSNKQTKVHTMEGFVYGNRLVMAILPAKDGRSTYRSIFSNIKPKGNDKAKLSGETFSSLQTLGERNKTLIDACGKIREELSKLGEANSKKMSEFESLVKNIPPEMNDQDTRTLMLAGFISSAIADLFKNAAMGYKAIDNSTNEVNRYLNEVVKALRGEDKKE